MIKIKFCFFLTYINCQPYYQAYAQPEQVKFQTQYNQNASPQYDPNAQPQYNYNAQPQYNQNPYPQYDQNAYPQYNYNDQLQYNMNTQSQYDPYAQPQYNQRAQPQYNQNVQPEYNQNAQEYYNQNAQQFQYKPNTILPQQYSIPQPSYIQYLAQEYRTINGFGNNVQYPQWGGAWTPYIRQGAPYVENQPNERYVSNMIGQTKWHKLDLQQSWFSLSLGNFMIHDFTFSEKDPRNQPWDIEVYNEPTFTTVIPQYRSQWVEINGVQEQINAATSYLDLSPVYGSDISKTLQLRAGVNGLMKSDPISGLPNVQLPIFMQGDPSLIYPAGDERANENPGLLVLHAIFLLNHNWHAQQIQIMFPQLCDDKIFEEARRRNIAEYQNIIFNEYIPQELGFDLGPYQGYDPSVNAQVKNEYATIGSRYYHSQIPSWFLRLEEDLDSSEEGIIDLMVWAFQPKIYVQYYGIASIIRGLCWTYIEAFDTFYVESLRTLVDPDHPMDLLAMDISRQRDHGNSMYNEVRKSYGLQPMTSFQQVNPDPNVYTVLQIIYGNNINICHTQICANAETPLFPQYNIGELHSTIVADQLSRARSGDRFWFERDYCIQELAQIYSVTMADVIKRVIPTQAIPAYCLQGPPTFQQWFTNVQPNCSPSYNGNFYDAIPVSAYFDPVQQKCVCQDPYAYFKASINICYCMHPYIYDQNQYKCVMNKDSTDYGDYLQYHTPKYITQNYSSQSYGACNMPNNYYTETSNVNQEWDPNQYR